jgi:hypothetical protein
MFKKLITNFISKILDEEIEKRLSVEGPTLRKLNLVAVTHGKKITVWDAILLDPYQLSLTVNWVNENGLETFQSYSSDDVASFRGVLKKGIKTEQIFFDRVSLHVKIMGSDTVVESLLPYIRGSNTVRYKSEELLRIIDQLEVWIGKRPELLI